MQDSKGDKDRLWFDLLLIILVGMIIGVLGAFAANGFVIGAKTLFELIPVSPEQNWWQSFSVHWLVLVTAAGVILALKRLNGIARWHGPADTILSAQVPKEPFQIKVGMLSTLAAFTSASAGASVGQYGPVVHFGASVASLIRTMIPTRIKPEVYLAAGVAAAISAGFNAPIAGVIFASEAVLRHFSVRALAPLAVASVSAAAITNLLFKRGAPYDIAPLDFSMHEVIPLLLVMALLSAAIAILFMSNLLKLVSWTGKQNNELLTIFLAASMMAVIGTIVPEVFGLGTATVNLFFSNHFELTYLLIILGAKFVASILCLGMGLFGGVFSPAIFLGACSGTVVGVIAVMLGYPVSVVPLMTTVGMACVASSVVGAPIAIVVIVFELTQSYQYAVAAIFSVAICSLISTRTYCYSYFDRQLLLRGFDLRHGRENLILGKVKVADLAISPVKGLSPADRCEDIVTSLCDTNNTEAYIVDEHNSLLGVVTLTNALRSSGLTAREVIDTAPSVLVVDQSLKQAMEVARRFVGEAIPVVSSDNKLLGSMSEGDILGAVLTLQEEMKADERN